MDKNYAHYKMLSVAQINAHENQNSGYEYILCIRNDFVSGTCINDL